MSRHCAMKDTPPAIERKFRRMLIKRPGDHEGHSLNMLRRVAGVLHARVRVVFEPGQTRARMQVAESPAAYIPKRGKKKKK